MKNPAYTTSLGGIGIVTMSIPTAQRTSSTDTSLLWAATLVILSRDKTASRHSIMHFWASILMLKLLSFRYL
jgi:hypothetical protein